MTDGNRSNPVVLILAVIGGIALLAVLGMWLLHGSMMMGGSLMGGGGWLIGLLILGALVALVVALSRRRT